MYRYFTLATLALFLLVSCKSDTSSKAKSEDQKKTEEVEKKYTLTPFSASPAFPDAKITSMNYTDGKFKFGVGGDSYVLGAQTSDAENKMCANSGKGQHIHLIVDNTPYAAKYVADFDYEIPDGSHHLLAFLSRSYHESIKTADARVAKVVDVENNTITGEKDITDPMLFYSRPKGTYVGKKDTEKVMLDFYLANTDISPSGNKVIANINGEDHEISKWQPYYIEGMPMGENTITLTLVDKDGKKVDTPLNPVTRKFTMKSDPAPASK